MKPVLLIVAFIALAGCQNPASSSSTTTTTTTSTLTPTVLAGVVTTLAGTTTSGSADGTGAAAGFYYPYGVATDGTNLYVADSNNNLIRKIVISTAVVTTLAGSTTSGSADGTGTAARFKNPHGVATDGTNLYIADTDNNLIRKIVLSTGVTTTLAGSTASGSADGTGTAARFYGPSGVATDGTNLYVADTGNYLIRKIVLSSGVTTTLAGSTTSDFADGTGTAARFRSPFGVATDGTNLYVADTDSNAIRKIVIATGVVTTLAGSATAGSASGTGAAATFYSPRGVATDGTNLYVADTSNNLIRKIDLATAAVTSLAGSTGVSSADGTGLAASFYSPTGVAVSSSDPSRLFVADLGNNLIRMIR